LVLASSNSGKLAEFDALFTPLGIEVVTQGSLGIEDAQEPYATFLENALAKARHAAAAAGHAALADDSGLCVDSLGGRPGVHSARFAGEPRSDRRNNHHLIELLQNSAEREAHYVCVLVLVRSAEDPEPVVAVGRMDGIIIDVPRGEGGFGYDPHFLIPRLNKTAAELSAHHKNRISHRARATRTLMRQLGSFAG
jgi:XTP/dITP diphosphohydrolase